MKISKFNCQEKELQMPKIQNFNFQTINRELRFDISADKILIKQLHDDLDKLFFLLTLTFIDQELN
jgi:hypothetical protein